MLREDNLGLGAKIGTQNAETFGLSMFSGLLGRLNGKEEDQAALKKKEETLRDVQLKLKYGNLNFVRGGLLVGDKMCEVKTDLGHLKEGGKKRKASDAEDDEDEEAEDSKVAKKRRKQEKKQQKSTNGTAAAIKEMKRQRKLEAGGVAEEIPNTSDIPSREAESTSDSTSSSEDEKPSSSSKRSKKSSRKESKRSSEDSNPTDKDEKARLKAEKRQRKEERRKRKEEKRAKRAAKEAKKDSKSNSAVASESEAATSASGTSTPTFMGGRQAVRHRYIMQKRMAAGSAQALKEIFMMKPQIAS